MNKTVLLACCDFLILATLSMLHFNKTPEKIEAQVLESSNEFIVTNESISEEETFTAFQELKIRKLQEELQNSQHKSKEQNDQNKALQTQNSKNLDQLKQLTNTLNTPKISIYKLIADCRWQVNLTMKEDDSISPDSFSSRFFTCAVKKGEKVYIPVEFNKLGLNWDELINDGHIDTLAVTVGRTGNNPWSSYIKSNIFAMHQDPSCCFIELPNGRATSAISILKSKNIHKHLNKLFAAKADGRLIKINNAAVLPDSPGWLDISEERFLSHPDKVEKGDLIVTDSGLAVGLITQEVSSNNRTRLRALIMDNFSFDEIYPIPLQKKKNESYYTDFVSSVREVHKNIK